MSDERTMNKMFITFGQAHEHTIGDLVFDRDCVAVINAETETEGRTKAFAIFGPKWCFAYFGEHRKRLDLSHFPRGLIQVPEEVNDE